LNLKKKIPFLLCVLLFVGCKSSPEVVTFIVDPGVNQYYFPPSGWTLPSSRSNDVMVDITYRTNSENPIFVNFSFFNKEKLFRRVSAISLEGEGIVYPLEDINTLFINSKRNELRVAAHGNRDTFLPLLRSEQITLRALVDGEEYLYSPGKDFYALRDQFLMELLD
jgi:hypothetical protein